MPSERIELSTFRLQGERINHFAKKAKIKNEISKNKHIIIIKIIKLLEIIFV